MKNLKTLLAVICTGLLSMAANAQTKSIVLEKSKAMAERDPHGFILCITSISVVFGVLAILWFVYTMFGKIFNRKPKTAKPGTKKVAELFKSKKKASQISPEVAAAIAMALEKENSSEVNAAIAMALHLHLAQTVHDQESYRLTIKPTFGPYASRQFTFRQLPEKK